MSDDRRKLLEQLSKQFSKTGRIDTSSAVNPKSNPLYQSLQANDLTQQTLAHEVLKNTGIPIPSPGARTSTIEDFYRRIMQERYPELIPDVDIADLKKDDATGIYYPGKDKQWIEIEKDLWKQNPQAAVGTLMHEAGHQYDHKIVNGKPVSKPINENFRMTGTDPLDAYEIVGQGHHSENIPGKRGVGTYAKAALENLQKKGDFRAHTGPVGAMFETLKNIYGPETEEIVKANPEAQAKIAKAYEAMQHNPSDPKVARAYDALVKEVEAQYDDLVTNKGLKVNKITDGTNPYQTSKDLVNDVRNNNSMSYFPTEVGYGTDGVDATPDHPLLQKTKHVTPDGKPMLANDLFRVVHDYYGHAEGENKFGATGEERAFQQHKKMLSPEAQKALASETRGQNSWVNYGPQGEANRANPANTIYAQQKAGLLPDEMTKPLEQIENPRFYALNKASKLAAKVMAPVGLASVAVPIAADVKEGNYNTALARGASMAAPIGTEEISDKLMLEAQIEDKAPYLKDPTYMKTLQNIGVRRQNEGRSPIVEGFNGEKIDTSATSDNDVMNQIIKARLQARQS